MEIAFMIVSYIMIFTYTKIKALRSITYNLNHITNQKISLNIRKGKNNKTK